MPLIPTPKKALSKPAPPGWRYETKLVRTCRVGDFVAIFDGEGSGKTVADLLNARGGVVEVGYTWSLLDQILIHDYGNTECVIRIEGPEFNEWGEVCP